MQTDFFDQETKSWSGFLAYLDRQGPGGAEKVIAKMKETRRQELAERKRKIRVSKYPRWSVIKDVVWHWGEDLFCAMHNLNPNS
jgi:hypothetical protein